MNNSYWPFAHKGQAKVVTRSRAATGDAHDQVPSRREQSHCCQASDSEDQCARALQDVGPPRPFIAVADSSLFDHVSPAMIGDPHSTHLSAYMLHMCNHQMVSHLPALLRRRIPGP
jgi:hypothetical protein